MTDLPSLSSLPVESRGDIEFIEVIDHVEGVDFYWLDAQRTRIASGPQSTGNLPYGAILNTVLQVEGFSLDGPGSHQPIPESNSARYVFPIVRR